MFTFVGRIICWEFWVVGRCCCFFSKDLGFTGSCKGVCWDVSFMEVGYSFDYRIRISVNVS